VVSGSLTSRRANTSNITKSSMPTLNEDTRILFKVLSNEIYKW
jgi:hypothetical protein